MLDCVLCNLICTYDKENGWMHKFCLLVDPDLINDVENSYSCSFKQPILDLIPITKVKTTLQSITVLLKQIEWIKNLHFHTKYRLFWFYNNTKNKCMTYLFLYGLCVWKNMCIQFYIMPKQYISINKTLCLDTNMIKTSWENLVFSINPQVCMKVICS